MTGNAAVRVMVRVRPFNQRESSSGPVISMTECNTTVYDPNNEFKVKDSFGYDKCLWSTLSDKMKSKSLIPKTEITSADQEYVYQCVGPEILASMWDGYNTCLFAYGQTGSGKTYTMMGDIYNKTNRGVIPRLCEEMFSRIKKEQSETPTLSFKVDASYHEIYNEKVIDLLDKSQNQLRVRQHPLNGPFVEGLSTHQVNDVAGIFSLLRRGGSERSTATTNLNDNSSRSHAIFTLTITRLTISGQVIDTIQTRTRVSKVNLVDLAGSERVASSGVHGDRFEEARNINLSLTTLGRVIDCLVERSEKKYGGKLPPYRESALTWLLSDSLGGNSKTFMIATISPSSTNFNETLSTLRYSSKARHIINKATVNKEEESGKLTAELREKISTLHNRLRTKEKHWSSVNESLEERCIAAETEVEALRNYITSLEAKLGSHGKFRQSDGEIERISKNLKEERSKSRRLEKQVRRLEQQLDVSKFNFDQEMKELTHQLKNEGLRLKEYHAELESKEDEVRKLFDEQDRTTSERDLLLEQLQRLESEHQHNLSVREAEKEKSHRINVLRKITRDQEAAKDKAETTLKVVESENQNLSQKVVHLQRELRVSMDANNQLQDASEASKKMETETRGDLTKTISDLQSQLSTAKSEVDASKQVRISLSTMQSELVAAKTDSLAREQHFRNEIDGMNVQIETHQRAKQVSENQLKMEKSNLKKLRQTIIHDKEITTNMVQQVSSLETERSSLRERVTALQHRIERVPENESKLEDKIQLLTNKCNDLQGELNLKEEGSVVETALVTTNKSLREKLHRQKLIIEKLQAELSCSLGLNTINKLFEEQAHDIEKLTKYHDKTEQKVNVVTSSLNDAVLKNIDTFKKEMSTDIQQRTEGLNKVCHHISSLLTGDVSKNNNNSKNNNTKQVCDNTKLLEEAFLNQRRL